jgi:hypothetical protein
MRQQLVTPQGNLLIAYLELRTLVLNEIDKGIIRDDSNNQEQSYTTGGK